MQHQAGEIRAIRLRTSEGGEMRSATSAECVEDRGLSGDYLADRDGAEARSSRQVTFIAEEAIAKANEESGLKIHHETTRRNVLTRGIDLNSLEGKRFSIGEVEFEGTSLCHPCSNMDDLNGDGGRAALKERGGICARVLVGGTIKIGDSILT